MILAIFVRLQPGGLLVAALIVGHKRAARLVTRLGRGFDHELIQVHAVGLFDLDAAVLRGVRQQAELQAFDIVARVLLGIGALDLVVVVLLLFFFLGRGGAVGDVRDVGVANRVQLDAARVHLCALGDDGAVVVIRHSHSHGAGQLELGFVRVLAGLTLFKGGVDGDALADVQLVLGGHFKVVAALVVGVDDDLFGHHDVLAIDLLRDVIHRGQAAVLELVAILGIGDQLELLAGIDLFEGVDEVVVLGLEGEDAAIGASAGQIDQLDLIGQLLELLVDILFVVIDRIDAGIEAVEEGRNILITC